jgi:nitrate/nitrite transporter NarK
MHFREFLKSGHPGTLFTSLLYFDFCFAVWVLNGAMAPFISQEFGLSDVESGLMVSVPVVAGALMRFPLGLLSQYIGRKNAAQLEMGLIVIGLLAGYAMVSSYEGVMAMGGGFLPIAMGISMQSTGSFSLGFLSGAALACVVLLALARVTRQWTTTWVAAGGRALAATHGDYLPAGVEGQAVVAVASE